MDINSLITTGVKKRPVKAVIYGVEGIGKTTFASHFPAPLIIDLDRGSTLLDVNRIAGINRWEDLISLIKQFIEMPDNPYKTLVIDTADAAAALCERYIIRAKAPNRRSIEEIPYGKGYKMLAEQFSIMMVWLEAVIDSGFNVCLVAHARLKTVTKPDDLGVYDHWELKLPGNSSNQLSPLIKEWADLLLFADYKVRLIGDGNKKKASGGERIMYTTHTAFADAKNRFGLDDTLPFDYSQIASIIPDTREPQKTPFAKALESAQRAKKAGRKRKTKGEKLAEQLIELGKKENITEKEIRKAVAMMGEYKESDSIASYDEEYLGSLIDQWDTFKVFIQQRVKGIPF